MIKDEISTQRIQAMKDRDEIKKNILSVALGEIQTVESREKSITEERCIKILKKIIFNNALILDSHSDKISADDFDKFSSEVEILNQFVPKTLSKGEVLDHLLFSSDPAAGLAVEAEPNVGKAIGLAMKYFKKIGESVDGKNVAEVVKQMKSEEKWRQNEE